MYNRLFNDRSAYPIDSILPIWFDRGGYCGYYPLRAVKIPSMVLRSPAVNSCAGRLVNCRNRLSHCRVRNVFGGARPQSMALMAGLLGSEDKDTTGSSTREGCVGEKKTVLLAFTVALPKLSPVLGLGVNCGAFEEATVTRRRCPAGNT